MKRQISYQLDISTIKTIARIANRRGVSESALVDLILKEHVGEYDGTEISLENVTIGHLTDAIERSRKRKG
jgi:hypothetical protein